MRLQTRLVALGFDKLIEAPVERLHCRRIEQARKGQETLFVEHGPLGVGQQRRACAERSQDP
jgi:hypothetical protein